MRILKNKNEIIKKMANERSWRKFGLMFGFLLLAIGSIDIAIGNSSGIATLACSISVFIMTVLLFIEYRYLSLILRGVKR